MGIGSWNLGIGVGACAIAGAGGALLARSQYERTHFRTETVTIASPKIKREKTIVFLTDLHNNEFGEDNVLLIEAIRAQHPDAVLVGGDTTVTKGRRDVRVAISLLTRLAREYPVFCGNGNHENRMVWEWETYGDLYETYKKTLQEAGVQYLENDTAYFGEDLAISGVDLLKKHYKKAFFRKLPPLSDTFLKKRLGEADHDRFQILLAHSPLYFEQYADWGADLTLSGHFHGGTIRLPLLGGVMTPQYQFFLPWCGGEFEKDGRKMLVGRGLGTHSINIRLNNISQLLVIKLLPDKKQ